MRIVAGRFGGRRLQVPQNQDIRPTSDKIRGAVFNMLVSRCVVEGAYVLDGFCGTGALGLEALSRGAVGCVFVDKSRISLDLARSNAAMLGLQDEVDFLLKDTIKIGQKPQTVPKATLIFLDPPYSKNLVPLALEALHEGEWIAQDAWVVCETDRDFQSSLPHKLEMQDEKIYGDTKIILGRYDPTAPE